MATTMDDVEYAETLLALFDRSPDDFAWRYPVSDQVESRRAQMNDQLIFDLLLSTGGIRRPDSLYPPTDVDSLKLLLDAIRDSTYDTLKKDCLIYYLLKWHKDGREEIYRDDKCIPPQFVLLADAYWYLDTGSDVAKAVSTLSDVRLSRNYPSKILQAISLSDDATPLILKYVRTAKPSLTEPIDIDMYTVALAQSSLLEAWQYQRTYPESSETRSRLVHKILEWSLSPHPRPEPLTQLLGFPFSNFEQTLIHKYALQPPPTLPPSSVPIIQDLVCVRLVQSGQYASAIKLDRRFAASIIPGTTSKMQKAIQDRRKMMDEILATLPAVERTLVEAELEVEATSGGASETSFYEKGKANADRLSMSWEEVQRPVVANGSAGRTKSVPKDLPLFSASPSVPISARNAMPRFGGSVSHLSDSIGGSTFVPISTSTSTPLQVRSQIQQSQFAARSNHALPLSSSQNSRTPAPLLGSSGIKYPAPLFTQPTTSATKPSTSLFTLAGSANQTRNAFYTPPVTNGVKRPLGADEARPLTEVPPVPNVADAPPAPTANGDVNMESEDDYAAYSRSAQRQRTEDAAPAELSYSVFGNSSVVKQPPFKSRRITRAETEMKMPPGAYVPDEEELAADQNQRQASLSPPPPSIKQTRSLRSRAHKLEHEPDLKRSVPGAFVSEDDNEEEDYVPPLPASPPPSKRPARKGRSSRSVGPENEVSEPAKPTRRSTRLTAASSVASTSPEPPSPPKPTAKAKKSTRTSGSASSKSGSRKK